MTGDHGDALAYFKKAGVLYKKIGDRVSYAYTFWSEGTSYMMMGRMKKAIASFNRSLEFFRQTKDPRGMVYCILGIGEIDYLGGQERQAKSAFLKAAKLADKYGFKLEKGYAEKLLNAFANGKGFPVNLP
jgi:tetratricopeptide (TPR) repeat protein